MYDELYRVSIMPEPVLKWAGGKRQILNEILGCFPPEDEINQYHEPFFGGGAIFFKETHPFTASINDINTRLTNFYWVVREYPDELIDENEKHEPNEEYYYEARERFNSIRNEIANFKNDIDARIREASLLLYLNRTCYNGLYRENADGEFNVPHGGYTNPDYIQSHRIQETSEALQGVNIYSKDFSYIRDEVDEGDLVYMDPPYKPVNSTSSFVEYSAGGFDDEEQERLRDLATELDEKGIHVVISNSPPIESKYSGLNEFEIVPVGARRSINSDVTNRGEVKEIIITNVDNRRLEEPGLQEFA